MADFYTAKELAELLGLHPQTIYRKLYRGELKSVKFGRTVRFPADQFDFTNHNLEVQSVDYKTLSIPSFVLSLFWDVDSKELKANDYQLIERVLDRGNIPEAKWLLSHVPESRLIEFIKKRGKRRLNKISLNFWQKFLGLKNGSDSSTRNPKKTLGKNSWR